MRTYERERSDTTVFFVPHTKARRLGPSAPYSAPWAPTTSRTISVR